MTSARSSTSRAYRLAVRAYRGIVGHRPVIDRVVLAAIGLIAGKPEPIKIAQGLPVLLREPEIETSASRDELEQMWDRVRRAWEHLGTERPFHSVLAHDPFLPARAEASEAEFWRSGEQEAGHLVRYLDTMVRLKDAALLEYGCGMGRVTIPMSRRVRYVDAYDFSAPHLDVARKRAAALGCGNVRTTLITNPFDAAFAPCDVFYSFIVLQHNPPPIVGCLLRKLIQALRPGGIGVFQVPTYRVDYRFNVADYLASTQYPDMEMHCFPQTELFSLLAEENAQLVQVRDDNATGRPDLFVSNTFVITKARERNLSSSVTTP